MNLPNLQAPQTAAIRTYLRGKYAAVKLFQAREAFAPKDQVCTSKTSTESIEIALNLTNCHPPAAGHRRERGRPGWGGAAEGPAGQPRPLVRRQRTGTGLRAKQGRDSIEKLSNFLTDY